MSSRPGLPPRFGPEHRRYLWNIIRQGPTEIGYAYFRARRRRRNRADSQNESILAESDLLAVSGGFDATDEDLAANRALIDRYRRAEDFEIRSIQWFLPYFHHAYFGGVYTLLRFADHFAREHGVESRFHCYDAERHVVDTLARKVGEAFPGLAGSRFTPAAQGIRSLPACDAAVATLWTSAYPVLQMRQARSKFYFVQDNEPQFYPAGAAAAIAEETYRFGFPGIVNTPGLAEVYRSYGNPAAAFVPAVDTERYHPPDTAGDPAKPVRVFFYGRPSTPRNAFGLGLASLRLLKERCGDRVEIISAGEHWNPGQFGVAHQIRNLGVLPLDEVGALYRSCDVGLVFMGTKHPSYQPFEFMASGVATVTNYNPSTAWLLRDGENCLVSPSLPTQVAERLERLVRDEELRARIQAAGLTEVRRFRWHDQIERIWQAMTRQDDTFALVPSADTPGGDSSRSELLGDSRGLVAEDPVPQNERRHE